MLLTTKQNLDNYNSSELWDEWIYTDSKFAYSLLEDKFPEDLAEYLAEEKREEKEQQQFESTRQDI